MEYLYFNNKPFSDFSTFWDGSQVFISPEKDVEIIEIVGRSGNLTIFNNRYKNVTIPFNCFIRTDFKENYSNLINYLLSQEGYGRIESSEEPDIFRLGQFIKSVEPNTGSWNKSAQFTIEFDCMPQKWLKSGEIAVNIDGVGEIVNPTLFNAKPLLNVTGTGQIKINESTMDLHENTGVTTIDCDLQDAYEGTINRNDDLEVFGTDFPVLKPGINNIEIDTGMTISIVPRWWKL